MDLRRSSGPDPCIQLGEKDHFHLTDEETRPRPIKQLVQTDLKSSKGGTITRTWPHTSLDSRARHVTGSSVPFPPASQFQVQGSNTMSADSWCMSARGKYYLFIRELTLQSAPSNRYHIHVNRMCPTQQEGRNCNLSLTDPKRNGAKLKVLRCTKLFTWKTDAFPGKAFISRTSSHTL